MSSSQSEERTIFLARKGKKSWARFIRAIVFCLYSSLPVILLKFIHFQLYIQNKT